MTAAQTYAALIDAVNAQRSEGFRPLWYQATRQLLITWETGKRQ